MVFWRPARAQTWTRTKTHTIKVPNAACANHHGTESFAGADSGVKNPRRHVPCRNCRHVNFQRLPQFSQLPLSHYAPSAADQNMPFLCNSSNSWFRAPRQAPPGCDWENAMNLDSRSADPPRSK
ncbi:hypothetical protein BC938DRAFT_478451 [Jimgerdemannia flammicorona]|uniref:Uncharacterized protein n=1 Tax=Jimgerdemannia flammicorona TaxID=994334 RepID=A0A433QMV0_9FUNG|nr:hypothetical protein BC938DRAFT_478451 [Jimgerdemannia flammicorona]